MKLEIEVLGKTFVAEGLTDRQVVDAIVAIPKDISLKSRDIRITREPGDKNGTADPSV